MLSKLVTLFIHLITHNICKQSSNIVFHNKIMVSSLWVGRRLRATRSYDSTAVFSEEE
jgi:hypothetical protein